MTDLIRVVGDPKPSPPLGSVVNVTWAGSTRISDNGGAFVLDGAQVDAYNTLSELLAAYSVRSANCQRRGDLCTWQIVVEYDADSRDELLATITEAAGGFQVFKTIKGVNPE